MLCSRLRRGTVGFVLFLTAVGLSGCGETKIDLGLEEAAESLEEGLKGVDPFRLGKLIDENQRLKESLERINRTLSTLALTGKPSLAAGSEIVFRVSYVHGEVRVGGWLNEKTPNSQFASERFIDHGGSREFPLTERANAPGIYEVWLELKPLQFGPPGGSWRLDWELINRKPNGEERTIHTGSFLTEDMETRGSIGSTWKPESVSVFELHRADSTQG